MFVLKDEILSQSASPSYGGYGGQITGVILFRNGNGMIGPRSRVGGCYITSWEAFVYSHVKGNDESNRQCTRATLFRRRVVGLGLELAHTCGQRTVLFAGNDGSTLHHSRVPWSEFTRR